MSTEPTKVMILTPAGRGAVATLAVTGPSAVEAVDRCFLPAGKPIAFRGDGQIAYGRWKVATGEDVVVSRSSPTHVEIHCHGGRTAVASILRDMQEHGCEAQTWQEWVARSGEDPVRQAARIALAEATTARTAAILLDQFNGALDRSIASIIQYIEAGNLVGATTSLQILVQRAEVGLHLIKPWRVVLAGRPNVGKSSLLNALLGYARSIVFDQPGTTRDVVKAVTALDGWPIEFADTAGLRASEDPLEVAGIRRAEAQLSDADLVLVVFDSTIAWTKQDSDLLAQISRPLVVHNKIDLSTTSGDRPSGVSTCAISGAGVAELADEIVARLIPYLPQPGDAIPFTHAQATAVANSYKALLAGNRTACLEQLQGGL